MFHHWPIFSGKEFIIYYMGIKISNNLMTMFLMFFCDHILHKTMNIFELYHVMKTLLGVSDFDSSEPILSELQFCWYITLSFKFVLIILSNYIIVFFSFFFFLKVFLILYPIINCLSSYKPGKMVWHNHCYKVRHYAQCKLIIASEIKSVFAG